jgi:hypothetical protein
MLYLSDLLKNNNPVLFCKDIEDNTFKYEISDSNSNYVKILDSKELLEFIESNTNIYGVINRNNVCIADKKSAIALDYIDDVVYSEETDLEGFILGINLYSEQKKFNNFSFRKAETGEVICYQDCKELFQGNSIFRTLYGYITIYNFIEIVLKFYPELVGNEHLKVIFNPSLARYVGGEDYHYKILDIYFTPEFARWHTKNIVLGSSYVLFK